MEVDEKRMEVDEKRYKQRMSDKRNNLIFDTRNGYAKSKEYKINGKVFPPDYYLDFYDEILEWTDKSKETNK